MSEPLLATPCTFGENGNFLLERELGSGGMGGVYMGRDKMLDRPVAVKVMLKEYGADAEFVGKFKKEAQAVAKLIHPNIAQVYSYGISDGMPYIAMELVAGGSLWSLMQAAPGKTDVTRVLKVCQQVAQALRCSTDQGFVHGDIKPENILLDANGNAKIVDFGLAGMQKDTSEIWGTPYYIAPEKVRLEPTDFRADMYNLGGTLYHALTNVPPFDGDDVTAVVKARFAGAPKKPSEVRPDLTPAVDALVMRMLELDKDKRFPSFEALIDEFQKVLTSGLETPSAQSADAAKPATGAKTFKRPTAVKGVRRMKTVPRRTAAKPLDPEIANQPQEDEESGVGMKVVGTVIAVVAIIGAVIGGLVWYKAADKSAREERHRIEIVTKVQAAREAIAGNRAQAIKFADEFDDFSKKAVDSCKSTTAELKKIMPEWANEMQPPPSKELLAAMASAKEGADGGAAADAMGAAMKGVAETMGAAFGGMSAMLPDMISDIVNQIAPQVGMQPPPKGFDPKSAEGQAYLKKLGEAVEKAQKDGKKIDVKPSKELEAKFAAMQAGKKDKDGKMAGEEGGKSEKKERPAVLDDLAEIWNRAYGCQACAIRIRSRVDKIVKTCDDAAQLTGNDVATMEKLAAISRQTLDALSEVKASKDVENAKKASGYIKQKGEQTVKKTVNKLRIEKLEADRKAAKEKEEAEEKARKEEEAKAKAELVQKEQEAAKAKFESFVSQGLLAQLDWSRAIQQLKNMKAEMKTPEGGFAVDHEIRKVEAMKMVQDTFKSDLPGYTFKKSKLKGNKVRKVDAEMIDTVKADGKTPQRLSWQKFYKEFHGNLNEAINLFVVKGRENGKKHFSLREWADVMCGAALTMRIICGDNASAAAYGEQLVKQVAKAFPDYGKNLKAMFPDIALDGEASADGEKADDKAEDKSDEKPPSE